MLSYAAHSPTPQEHQEQLCEWEWCERRETNLPATSNQKFDLMVHSHRQNFQQKQQFMASRAARIRLQIGENGLKAKTNKKEGTESRTSICCASEARSDIPPQRPICQSRPRHDVRQTREETEGSHPRGRRMSTKATEAPVAAKGRVAFHIRPWRQHRVVTLRRLTTTATRLPRGVTARPTSTASFICRVISIRPGNIR